MFKENTLRVWVHFLLESRDIKWKLGVVIETPEGSKLYKLLSIFFISLLQLDHKTYIKYPTVEH